MAPRKRCLLPLSSVKRHLRGKNLPSDDALRRLVKAAEDLLASTTRLAAQETIRQGRRTITQDHMRDAIRRALYPSTQTSLDG